MSCIMPEMQTFEICITEGHRKCVLVNFKPQISGVYTLQEDLCHTQVKKHLANSVLLFSFVSSHFNFMSVEGVLD